LGDLFPLELEFESFAPLGIGAPGPKATWKGTVDVPSPADECPFWAFPPPLKTMEERGALPLGAEDADVATFSRKTTAPTAIANVSGNRSHARRRSGNPAFPVIRIPSRNPCMLAMIEGSAQDAGIRLDCRMKFV
jgi:hypothetical protein